MNAPAAGRLRERIKIQQAAITQDSSGTPIETWSDVASLPAESIAVGGGEMLRGRQVHAEATQVFVVRYRTGLNTRQRILWNDQYWGIVSIGDPYGQRKELRVECKGAV